MKDQESPSVQTLPLYNEKYEENFYHADNAPVFSRRKESLARVGTVGELELNDTFYVELWGGQFAGVCYFMKVVRKREEAGLVDCIWLSKRKNYFRDICGRAIWSDIPENTVVYRPLSKKRKCEDNAGKTPKKIPKYLLEQRKKAFPSLKHALFKSEKEEAPRSDIAV